MEYKSALRHRIDLISLNKESGEIFSYDWDLSEYDGTRLNAKFVSFLKEGD